ncbi:hypothetical protein OAO87_01525 [bacterium]|nr:hypothetical protein [bacterium]
MPSTRTPRSTRGTLASTNTGEDTDTTADSSKLLVKPEWDTATHTLPTFHHDLLRYLPKKDRRFKSLVRNSTMISGRYTVYLSLNHIDRVATGSVTDGTFIAPCAIKASDRVACKAVAAGSTTPAADGANVKNGQPVEKGDIVNPDLIQEVWDLMHSTILESVDDEDTCDEWEVDHPTATELLIFLENERKSVLSSSNNYGSDILTKFDAVIRKGLGSVDVVGFNLLKSESNALRKKIKGTSCVVPDELYAAKLATAVRLTGDFIAAKLDAELSRTSGRGDLKKTKAAIIQVLSEHSADQRLAESQGGGRGLYAGRDPRPPHGGGRGRGGDGRGDPGGRGGGRGGRGGGRGGGGTSGLTHPDRAWTEADGDCGHCKTLGKPRGTHWNADCRYREESKAKRLADRKAREESEGGNGRAAVATLQPLSDDDAEDGEECGDVVDEDEAASVALFAAGRTSLLDTSYGLDASAVLESVRVRGDGASVGRGLTVTSRAPLQSVQELSDGEGSNPASPEYSATDSDSETPPPLVTVNSGTSSDAPTSPPESAVPMGTPVDAARVVPLESLTPTSPMSDFKLCRESHSSPMVKRVSMSVGGSSRRTRADILDEMRRAAGLPNLPGTAAPSPPPSVASAGSPIMPDSAPGVVNPVSRAPDLPGADNDSLRALGYIARRKSSPPDDMLSYSASGTLTHGPTASNELTWGVLWDERRGEGRTVGHPGKDDSNAIALARQGDGRILFGYAAGVKSEGDADFVLAMLKRQFGLGLNFCPGPPAWVPRRLAVQGQFPDAATDVAVPPVEPFIQPAPVAFGAPPPVAPAPVAHAFPVAPVAVGTAPPTDAEAVRNTVMLSSTTMQAALASTSWLPPQLHLDSCPQRQRLRERLASQYEISACGKNDQHGPDAGMSPPPRAKSSGAQDELIVRSCNVSLGRESGGKLGNYILICAGSGRFEHARAANRVHGSTLCVSNVTSIREILGDLLAFGVSAGRDEDVCAFQLGRLLAPDFEWARAEARRAAAAALAAEQLAAATPPVRQQFIPNTPPSPPAEPTRTAGCCLRLFDLTARCALIGLVLAAAVAYVGSAADAPAPLPLADSTPARFHDPGTWLARLGSLVLPFLISFIVASLPIGLAMLAALLANQLLCLTSRGDPPARRLNAAPPAVWPRAAGAPLRGPSGHANRPTPSPQSSAAHSRSTHCVNSIGAYRRSLHLAAASVLAVELTPSGLLSLPAQAFLALLAAFFFTGAVALRSRHPPAYASFGGAVSRLHPRIRVAGGRLIGTFRSALQSPTRIRRYLLRLPLRLARLAYYATILLSLGRLRPHCPHFRSDAPQSYRAACELDLHSVVRHASTRLAAPPQRTRRARRAEHSRPLMMHNLSAATHRALISKHTHCHMHLSTATRRALLGQKRARSGVLRLIVDSGCTMHCHPHESDLINKRATRETMSGAEGAKRSVKCIGDLPIAATDADGKTHRILLRNVRCVPQFTETLISVDQLFELNGA